MASTCISSARRFSAATATEPRPPRQTVPEPLGKAAAAALVGRVAAGGTAGEKIHSHEGLRLRNIKLFLNQREAAALRT